MWGLVRIGLRVMLGNWPTRDPLRSCDLCSKGDLTDSSKPSACKTLIICKLSKWTKPAKEHSLLKPLQGTLLRKCSKKCSKKRLVASPPLCAQFGVFYCEKSTKCQRRVSLIRLFLTLGQPLTPVAGRQDPNAIGSRISLWSITLCFSGITP